MAGMVRTAASVRRATRRVLVVALALVAIGMPAAPHQLLSPAGASAGGFWTSGGPPGGSATAIAVDPATPAIAFAGTAYGVFKTTDGGATWAPASAGMPVDRVRSLAIDASSPQTIYAGTDAHSIYKSTNGGSSWSTSGTGLSNNLVVGLAVGGGSVYATLQPDGVARSTDGGASWAITQLSPGTTTTTTSTTTPSVVGPTTSLSVFVQGIAVTPAGVVVATLGGGVYFSTDGSAYAQVVSGDYVAVAFNATLGTFAGALSGGILRSTDGGATWSSYGSASGSVRSFTFAPTTPPVAYVGANGAWRDDGSGTWTGLGPADNSFYGLGATSATTLVGASFVGGVLRTSDGGTSWSVRAGGLPGIEVRALAQRTMPFGGQGYLAGTQSGIVYGSLDGGATWAPRTNGIAPGSPVTALLMVPGGSRVYAAQGSTLYKSTDDGATWSPLFNATYAVWHLELDPGDPSTFFAASQQGQVIRITDGASLTSVTGTGLPVANVWTVVADGATTPATLYAGTQGGGIFRSTDRGATWSGTAVATLDGTGPDVHSLVIDATTTPHTLWAGGGDGRVFKSTDPMTGYTEAGTGLPSGYGNEVALAISGSTVLAGVFNNNGTPAAGGAFEISTSGSAWTALATDGLIDKRIRALVVDGADPNTLRGATPAGVFSITQPGAVSAPTVQSLQPQSTPQCATSCAAVPVAIHGSGFGPGSGVLLDTTEYAPTYVSSSELDLAIPGALLSPARTVQVRVRTGTQVSDPVPFFITETAAAVQSSDTATSTSSSGTASASTGGVGVTATGAGTVTVAQYSADPVSVPPPAGTSNFFDVNIAAGSFTSVQVIDCALDPANTSHLIYWYDGTQWLPVSNQTYVAPCVTMVFTNVSAPAIADLVGTPLAEGNGSVRSAVVGPENTEGILRVSAGDWLSAGYRLKLTTKSKKTVSVSLTNARLVVPVTCGDGRSATLEVALQGRTYTLPAGSTSWTPTADADSPSGYQGAIRVVDACSGTGMRTTSRGASLVASVTTSPDRVQVSLSFHYRDPKAKGKHDISCADVSTNREPGVSDCTATWSAATTV